MTETERRGEGIRERRHTKEKERLGSDVGDVKTCRHQSVSQAVPFIFPS